MVSTTPHLFSDELSFLLGYCAGVESPDAACGVGGVSGRTGTCVSLDGETNRLDVNLTWQATTPLAQKMYFWAVAGVGCESEDGFQPRALITEPIGDASPFRIAVDPEMQVDEDIRLFTQPFCTDPGPACAYVAVEQHLLVEGTVWTTSA